METLALLLFFASIVIFAFFIIAIFKRKPKSKLFIGSLVCFALSIIIIPTSDEEASKKDDNPKTTQATEAPKESQENKPTQEELDAKLKQEAVEADFVAANGGEYETGKEIKATGEITNLLNKEGEILPVFTLTTKESDGFGMYTVKVMQANTTVTQKEVTLSNGTKLTEGTQVTVYGTYDGRSEVGFPLINSTVIEANIEAN